MTGSNRHLLREYLRTLFLIVFISAVLFLFLLQRVRSRELTLREGELLARQQEIFRLMNRLDFEIERLKAPERIISLAERSLGMQRSGVGGR
jgi:cell division protein FtsL